MCMRLIQRFKEKLLNFFHPNRRPENSRPPTPRFPEDPIDNVAPDINKADSIPLVTPRKPADVDGSNQGNTKRDTGFHQDNTKQTISDVDRQTPKTYDRDNVQMEDKSHPNRTQVDGSEKLLSPEKSSRAGKVLMSFSYLHGANKLNMRVIRSIEQPPKRICGTDRIRIHLCLLPQRKPRFRSKTVPVTQSQAIFNQTFRFVHMTEDLLENCVIRLRVYGIQRFSKQMLGETKISLAKTDLTTALADRDIWRNLQPKGPMARFYGIKDDDEDDHDDFDEW